MFEWGEFSDKQLNSILNADKRINIWQGSVRSGKTIASIVRWLEYLESGPKGKKLMIGKTQRTLKRNILDVVQDIVGADNFNFNRGLGEVQIYDKKVYIAGANDMRAEDKIRGMTLAGAYCDEVSIYPEGFFQMLLSRLSVKGAKVFLTTNPEGPYHWLKKNYLDRENELDLNNFHFTLKDNLTLDPEYVKQLKKEYQGVFYQRYIKGLWVIAEGLVYQNFREKENIVDDLPDMKQHFISIDYGTANPTAFVLVGLGIDNKFYVIDEYRHSGRESTPKTDRQYAEELKEFILKNDVNPKWIFIDPSAKSFITQLYQLRHNFNQFRKVAKANNEVINGIRRVSSLVAERKLLVHNSCESLISEFNSYSWNPKKQQVGEDVPIKENDHLLDALRYCISGNKNLYKMVINN